jgi:hypothetical protein
MIESASASAEMLFYKQGEVLPIWQCIDENGKFILLAHPPTDDKEEAFALIKEALPKLKIIRVLFINEAWTLKEERSAPTGAELDRVMREGLRNHPKRNEVVMFWGEDYENGVVTACRKIIRAKGSAPMLGPLEFDTLGPGTVSQGRLASMLPPRGKMQ